MKTIELFQWDLNKKVPCSFPEAHFACIGSEDALIVKANGGNAQIPNVLLQEGKDIMCWFMEGGAVADSGRIRIVTRAKPADYIYTETEVITFESLVAKVEDVIAKGNAATDSATTAAQKAEAAANKANAASDKAAQVEAEIKASEARRVEAEQGRAEAEATRAAHESKRAESFNTNLTSWNSKVDAACKKATDTASKAAQDAKTATDAAIAKTEEATQAAVAKAQTATDNATTAANKAETAVSKLPLPLGNTLKGEVESTMVSVHDAYPAPLVTTKVMGQSNQTTTKGANLFDVSKVSSATSNGITMSVEDGCIKLSGTNTAAGVNNIEIVAGLGGKGAIISAGKYTATVEGISQASLIIQLKDNTFASLAKAKPSAAIDNKSEQSMTYFLFQIPQGVTVNEKVKVWFEKGDKSLKEPYTGGKPSPSPEYPQEMTNLNKAELVITGRNLVEQSTTLTNALNRFSSCLYVEANLLPSTNYVLSFNDVVGNGYYINEALFSNFHTFTTKSGRNVVKLSTKAEISKANTGQYAEPGWIILKNDKNQDKAPAFTDVQIELGDTETTYEPHQSKSTAIDLQGNELCSLPNGVKDEVVIDADGNVSLIKKVTSVLVTSDMIQSAGEHANGQKYVTIVLNNCVRDEKPNVMCSTYIPSVWTDSDKRICIPSSTGAVITDSRFTDKETAANILTAMNLTIFYQLAEPQTIPLGKVELPALPEATSNVWNDGNIPANVYINYLKDVNIAYSDLENQIKQITAALSVMDTPTVIPEMAWGTPAAI